MSESLPNQIIVESNWKKFWRPIAAFVYLSICIFDFAVMGAFYEFTDNITPSDLVNAVKQLEEPEVKIAVINALMTEKSWEPLTLKGNAVFHVTFGAILGIAAWTRGTEKRVHAENGKYLS